MEVVGVVDFLVPYSASKLCLFAVCLDLWQHLYLLADKSTFHKNSKTRLKKTDIHSLQIISFINKREFKCDSNFYLQSTGGQNCLSSKIDITFIYAIFEGVESSQVFGSAMRIHMVQEFTPTTVGSVEDPSFC